jgi:hypothetical protein
MIYLAENKLPRNRVIGAVMSKEEKTEISKQAYVILSKNVRRIYRFFADRKELSFVLLLTIISASMQVSFSLSTWGFVHADEIFQSIEIAHDMVYGYGTIPPEFQESNPETPSYAKARSYLFPIIFTIPMYIGKLFGWNYWKVTIPLIRILLGINGALLTPATYIFVRRYTKGKKTFASASAVITVFSPILMFSAFRSVTNIFLVPWIMFIICSFWKTKDLLQKQIADRKQNEMKTKKSWKLYLKITILSFLMGLIIYIRIDFIISIVAILLLRFPYKKIKLISCNLIGLGFAAVFGGLIDFITYGDFLISPVQWFRYNIIEGLSSIHGVSTPLFYFKMLLSSLPLIIFVVFCTSVVISTFAYSIRMYIIHKEVNWILLRNVCGFPLASMIIISLFSIPSHKEIRFIYLALVFLQICFAISLALSIKVLLPKISSYSSGLLARFSKTVNRVRTERIFNYFYTSLFFVLVFLGAVFASYEGSKLYDWRAYNELARGLVFIGQLEECNGLVMFTKGTKFESYFYFHKDVPLDEYMDLWGVIRIRYLIRKYSEDNTTFNFIMFNREQIDLTPNIETDLTDYNYFLFHTINSEVFIYKFNTTI